MAKSFRCQDAGVICRAELTGASDDEVLAKAVSHAREVHGVDLADSRTLTRYVVSLIRDDGQPIAGPPAPTSAGP